VKPGDKANLIGPVVRGWLERHPAFSASPLGDWGELVGEQVARYSRPKSLKNKVLVVVAFDSIWKHHLELNRHAVMEKINENRREPLVEEMIVRVGGVPESDPVLNPAYVQLAKLKTTRNRGRKYEKTPVRPLAPEEKALLKKLPDPDLRTIGARLLKRIPVENTPEDDE